jgi:imidazolonepropionase-like amidohydrolase
VYRVDQWQAVSLPKVAFYNFQLFDGVADRRQEDLVLLVDGKTIRSVERAGELAQYDGYRLVDLEGRTVLPGLIDNHVHLTVPFMFRVNLPAVLQMNRQIAYNLRSCVMSGVTTVRDVGGFPAKINRFRASADRNQIPGPRVVSSLSPIAAREGGVLGAPEVAPHFTNPVLKWILGGNYAERPTEVEGVVRAGEEMVRQGAQWLKTLYQEHSYSYQPHSLPNHSDEGYRAILELGRMHGLKCALHQVFLNGFKKGVDLGFDTLEHIPIDAPIPDEDVEAFLDKEMAIMPTMMAFGDILAQREILDLVESRGEEFLVPEARSQASANLKAVLAEVEQGKPMSDAQYNQDMFANAKGNLTKLYTMGATIGIGTDMGGTYCGFFGRYADELAHCVSAGISSQDALRMATSVNARILDMEDEIGTIEPGKLADLVAVDGDPLQEIGAMRQVSMVMKGGMLVKAEGIQHLEDTWNKS